MMKRSFWLTLVAMLVAVFALGACTAGGDTGGGDDEGAGGDEPVTITIWHGYTETEEETFSQTVEDFQAANPNITVEVLAVPFDELQNKFQTEAATGAGPTLITGPQDRMAAYADAGLLATIPEDAEFLSALIPSAVDGGRVNGELVGVPINNKVLALFYNTSMVSEVPADFDALLASAAENGMALTADWFHNYMWAPAFGADFFNEDYAVVIDSPEGAEAYAYFKSVCESEGVVCDGNDGDMDTLFRQGEVAYRIQGPWMAGDAIADLGEENVAVAAIPPIPGQAAPRPWNQAEIISINSAATEAELDAALEFIAFLTSQDVQATFLE
ncbi:MAG: extracellular solute-binding protein, partial [Chloroflexi bacterium]|nr:extracellular solute-binding protein [Chloroflexota bacterium]